MNKKLLLILTSILILCSGCKDNRSVDELFNDIDVHIKNQKFLKAKSDVEKLVKLAPGNSNAFLLQGMIEMNLESDYLALLNFSRSISLDSSNYIAYIERAKLKIKLGDYRSAISDCNTAHCYTTKEYYPIYETKGLAYESLKDIPNAVIQYEHSIKYGNDSGIIFYKLGVLYLGQGDYQKGCSFLSKAGERGFMDAYDLIKSNCNKCNEKNNKNGKQTKVYPNRFSMTFPFDWSVNEIESSDKTIWSVSAIKDGNLMMIGEINPAAIGNSYNYKSIYEIDKEEMIYGFREDLGDFELRDFKKKKLNGVDAYYFKMEFSSKNQKIPSRILIQYGLINPKTKKLYYLQGRSKKNDINEYEPIFCETFETFKLL